MGRKCHGLSEQCGFHFENKLSRCSCCPMPMMKEQWSEMVWSKFIAGLVSRPRLIESDGLPNIPLCSTKHCQFLTSVAKTCWFKANIKLTQIIYLNHQLHHCLHDQPKSKKNNCLFGIQTAAKTIGECTLLRLAYRLHTFWHRVMCTLIRLTYCLRSKAQTSTELHMNLTYPGSYPKVTKYFYVWVFLLNHFGPNEEWLENGINYGMHWYIW